MPTEHATFGSSTAKRTNHCPAWVELSQGVPRRESQAAQDGTLIHNLCENMLLEANYSPPADTDPDLIDKADALMDAVDATMNKYHVTEYEPEIRCHVSDDVFGTLDFIGMNDAGLAIFGDIKSGQGVQVEAENNDQLLFAAWAALQTPAVRDLVGGCEQYLGVIWQPDRAGHVQTKEWAFTVADVQAWGDKHLDQIAKARKGGQTPTPGDHCAFCPAAFKCPAKTGDALRAMQLDPNDLQILATSMDMVEDLKAWCRDVEKAAYAALEVGQPVAGWKLVASRATRKWADEKAAIEVLRKKLGGLKQITTTKLLGLGAIEKLVKAKGVDIDIDALCVKESTGTTLAPESDKRPAVLSAETFAAALASIQ
jgi:hypothetical protein